MYLLEFAPPKKKKRRRRKKKKKKPFEKINRYVPQVRYLVYIIIASPGPSLEFDPQHSMFLSAQSPPC